MEDSGLIERCEELDSNIDASTTAYYCLNCEPRDNISDQYREMDEYLENAIDIGWSPHKSGNNIIQTIKPHHIEKEVGSQSSRLYYNHPQADGLYPLWIELARRATQVYYVGRTTSSLASRLKQHQSEPLSSFMQLHSIQSISRVHTLGRPDLEEKYHSQDMHRSFLGGHIRTGEKMLAENVTSYEQDGDDCTIYRFAFWR